jgi:hypothetical protein
MCIKKTSFAMLQNLRPGSSEYLKPLSRGSETRHDLRAALSVADKSTVLVPILFCTNDQSDFSSPSATVIGELRKISSTNAQRMNATKRVTNGYNDRQDTVDLGKARSPAWR